MRGVVNQIVERQSVNGKPYWRVEILDRRGRGRWYTLFDPPTFMRGEEVDFIAYGNRLIVLRDAYRHMRELSRAILVLAAAQMGARTPEDALALAQELERYVRERQDAEG